MSPPSPDLGKTLKQYGSDAKPEIKYLQLPDVPKLGPRLVVGVENDIDLDLKLWDKEVGEYMAQMNDLNPKTSYIILQGQWSEH